MAQKFITKPVEKAILKTPYGTTEKLDGDDKPVIARYFNPYGAGTWYVLEDCDFASEGKIVYGAADLGSGLELGTISLTELENLDVTFLGMHGKIERDTSVTPLRSSLGQLRKLYKEEWM